MRRILIILAVVLSAVTANAQQRGQMNEDVQSLQKLNQFYRYLGAYVDTVNTKSLVESAIEEMLSKLDPHSAYVSAEDMVGVKESFDANFEGIGIEFNIINDTLMVVNTISGGPSERVGLLPNDRITAVNDSLVVGIKQRDVPKVLRGPKGTVVYLTVVRKGVAEPLTFKIVRDKIPILTVDAAYKVDPKTGYVKINRFAATTNSELQQAIASMSGIESLILDLRGNGGGFLDQAIAVSSNFLKKGSLVVSTEGRAVPSEKYNTVGNPTFNNGRLVVLVDEFSASASEIVAGAVQDWDAGIIVGAPTYGKGLVQRQLPLVDGSAVRLTVARYHTPTGRVIQRPYEMGNSEKYREDFSRRFADDADSVAVVMPDSLKYKTLRLGRTVYGGGGVTPDVIVKRDTTAYSDYWAKLVRNALIRDFSIEYVDRHRDAIVGAYSDFSAYDRGFVVDSVVLGELVLFADKRGVAPDSEGLRKSEREIRAQLKGLIAQKVWGEMTDYFRVVNRETDEGFKRALEVLRDWDLR